MYLYMDRGSSVRFVYLNKHNRTYSQLLAYMILFVGEFGLNKYLILHSYNLKQ